MPSARPSRDEQGRGKLAVISLGRGESLGSVMLGVHVDDDETGARADRDVCIGPLAPPGLNRLLVGGRVLLPRFDSRMLTGSGAGVFTARTLTTGDVEQGKDGPASGGIGESGCEEGGDGSRIIQRLNLS